MKPPFQECAEVDVSKTTISVHCCLPVLKTERSKSPPQILVASPRQGKLHDVELAYWSYYKKYKECVIKCKQLSDK